MNYYHGYLSDLKEGTSRTKTTWRPSEEDICAIQHAIQQLEWIASGTTPGKNCDLSDDRNKATIRHAMQHAKSALNRLKPAFDRIKNAYVEAETGSAIDAAIPASNKEQA